MNRLVLITDTLTSYGTRRPDCILSIYSAITGVCIVHTLYLQVSILNKSEKNWLYVSPSILKKLVQSVKLFRQPTGLRSITATGLRKAGGHGRLAIDRCSLCKKLLWFKMLLPIAIDRCLSEETVLSLLHGAAGCKTSCAIRAV